MTHYKQRVLEILYELGYGKATGQNVSQSLAMWLALIIKVSDGQFSKFMRKLNPYINNNKDLYSQTDAFYRKFLREFSMI